MDQEDIQHINQISELKRAWQKKHKKTYKESQIVEDMTCKILREQNIVPDIEPTFKSKGSDATAKGYLWIDIKGAKCSELDWQKILDGNDKKRPAHQIDMSTTHDASRLFEYDGLALTVRETFNPTQIFEIIWISKEHIEKVHPYFQELKTVYDRALLEQKKGGPKATQRIFLSVAEIKSRVGEDNLSIINP